MRSRKEILGEGFTLKSVMFRMWTLGSLYVSVGRSVGRSVDLTRILGVCQLPLLNRTGLKSVMHPPRFISISTAPIPAIQLQKQFETQVFQSMIAHMYIQRMNIVRRVSESSGQTCLAIFRIPSFRHSQCLVNIYIPS